MMKLHIKNMVCDRCKRVVREELEGLGIELTMVDWYIRFPYKVFWRPS